MVGDDFKQLLKARVDSLAKKPKPEKGIYSPIHALAKEISEYCGEPKEFAMYLGIVKNIGLTKAYRIFSEIKHSPNVTTRGKLFLFKSKYNLPHRQTGIKNETGKRVRKSPPSRT